MSVPKNNETEQKRKKATAAIVAIFCIIALLITGTWAYYNSVSALNRFNGGTEIVAVLHDDYDQDGEKDSDGTKYYEKKVYVENAGESSLIVRVTLEEYMEYLNKEYPTGAARKDSTASGAASPWHYHTYTKDNAGAYVCADCGEVYHEFYQLILAGDTYQPNDKSAVARFEAADAAYEYKEATQSEKDDGLAQRYEYDSVAETWKDTWTGATKGGKTTACEVVAMEEYLSRVAAYEKDNTDADGINPDEWEGWIMDTDGYIYWSQRLAPGEATGLLLSGVLMSQTPYGDESYYAIDVVMEAVDDVDIDSWIDGTTSASGIEPRGAATENAAKLLDRLRQLYPYGDIGSTKVGEVVALGDAEWIVLEKDETAGTAVILSKEFVTTRQYHTATSGWQWSTSAIYEYLNGDYYNKELPVAVRNMAVKVENKTNLPGAAVTTEGDVSEEYVYLLSYNEYLSYSSQYNGTIDFSANGPYPVSGNWWLRTPYTTATQAYTVAAAGTTNYNNVSISYGVRPALTVQYK